MIQNPQDKHIKEVMRPGVLSHEGFMGDDTRGLKEIIAADQREIEKLGVTNLQLAGRLNEILMRAVEALGSPVKINDNLTAEHHEARGRIPCPFGDGNFDKGEVVLRDLQSGQEVIFTPLSVHLIDRHGFYQGRGSRYRLEPGLLRRILDL